MWESYNKPRHTMKQEQSLDDMSSDEIDIQDREDADSMPTSHVGYSVNETCYELKKNRGIVYAISGGDGTYGVFTNLDDARAIEEQYNGTIYEVPLNQYLDGDDMPVEM